MLLFIRKTSWRTYWYDGFNTSHVTLYLSQTFKKERIRVVSIHLMLLFISEKQFQWSRISVSIHLMLLFIEKLKSYSTTEQSFNTSHVTLYQVETYFIDVPGAFQYISCYSLSCQKYLQKGIKVLFQYISCYSLSQIHWISAEEYQRFNTSHVTLYRKCPYQTGRWLKFQYISCYSLSI